MDRERSMSLDQFAEFAAAVVRQLPRNLSVDVAQRHICEQGRLREVLLKALDTGPAEYELHLISGQSNGVLVGGQKIERILRQSKPEAFEATRYHKVVSGWLDDPTTYPEELKGKFVCLWGSTGFGDGYRFVHALFWNGKIADLVKCVIDGSTGFGEGHPAHNLPPSVK
jgi:hypothetical protein